MLVDALPDEMVYPDETAIWEDRLYQMSEGKDSLQAFLDDQIAFLKRLVTAAGTAAIEPQKTADGNVVTCPQCGSPMVLRHGKYGNFYGCSQYPKCRCTRQDADAHVDERIRSINVPAVQMDILSNAAAHMVTSGHAVRRRAIPDAPM